MKIRSVFILLSLSFAMFSPLPFSAENRLYDILIKNGTVIDGSGNPWYKADIGIRGKEVVRIGKIDSSLAREVIDAKGLAVTPGFIDVHTHCDRGILEIPTVDNYLLQGVTTIIGGNCGSHPFPLRELFENIEKQGISPNFGCLIGHNTIRHKVMGFRMEFPAQEDMEKMKNLISEDMKAGALGFSTGLAYLPGIYSNTEELVELASAVASYGGIYTSHIRDQGDSITESIEEAIAVGEKNGIPVLVSHIKLAKESVWGDIGRIRKPVENARSRGVEVFLDQYPYTATSSGFTSSFPSWAFEGGRESFLGRLKDPALFKKIKETVIERRLTSTKGIDKLETIFVSFYKTNKNYNGKNLKEILIERGEEPTVPNGADLIIEIEKNGGAQGVFFQMDEEDVVTLMKLPYLMHASDGGIQEKGRGVPHPRSYGTFPRIFANYVKEKGILSPEEAVRKMTSLPAQVFRLEKRGLIKAGFYADITIFDIQKFKDTATFSAPHRYSQGLHSVLVNGDVVVKDNVHTGKKPGMICFGPGKE